MRPPRKEAFILRKNQDLLDEDLLLLIHQGNIAASEELFARYKFYAWRVAYDFNIAHPNSGISLEEYHQVAYSSLAHAIKVFTSERGFYNYWKTIAINEMVRYFNDNSYVAYLEYQTKISMDDTKDDGVLICEEVGEVDRSVTERIIREELRILKDEALDLIKKEEDKTIINLFLEERSLREIHVLTSISYRHIQYVVKRFQSAFAQILKKRNYN